MKPKTKHEEEERQQKNTGKISTYKKTSSVCVFSLLLKLVEIEANIIMRGSKLFNEAIWLH